MDWIERLNRIVTGRVILPGIDVPGSPAVPIEVYYWAHEDGLLDNVPHRHTFFEVCLVGACGSGIFRVRDTEYPLQPGDLFIARPGVLHQIQNTGSALMELSWVSFSTEPHTTGDTGILKQFANADVLVVPETTHRLSKVWNSALRSMAESDTAQATVSALASALLIGIIHAGSGQAMEAIPTSSSQTANHERLARLAIRYIHDNLNRPISVSEVAAQVHLSPRHLSRLFVSFTGVAPAAYIERARIDRASTLLLRTDDPIKRIAEAVGYDDIHHFSRAFARVQSIPPGAYRNTNGGPIRRDATTEPSGSLV